MLYVTTRNKQDTVTANRAIHENRGADGGFYLPLRMPKFSDDELQNLFSKGFGQTVADILNLLLSTKLTSWDIDFCIGRYPVRIVPLGHKLQLAETWHNPEWNYERLVNNLFSLISQPECPPTDWARISIRIAVLFGIFGELKLASGQMLDVSVVSADLSALMSVWYAKNLGLPAGNVICCCNENNSLWELLCHGQMRTDMISISTNLPEADVVLPLGMERLVFACGSSEEVSRFLDACQQGSAYIPSEAALSSLRRGMYVSVVSSRRIAMTIPNVYKTHNHLVSSYTALAYAGLLDYRAKTGATRSALVLSEHSPFHDLDNIALTLDISRQELVQKLNH